MTRSLRLLAVLCLASAASAQSPPAVPELTSRVMDLAGVLSPSAEADLGARLAAHEDSTTNQIAVLTIVSLQGAVLEEYATRVFREWGLGTAEENNGVLVLVARDERKIRIEVGYGLEGSLPDALAARIIRNEMSPRFKKGDFEGGVTAAVGSILSVAEGFDYRSPKPGIWYTLLALVCLLIGGSLWSSTWREGVDSVPVAINLMWALIASVPMYPVVRVVTAYVVPDVKEGMRWYVVLLVGAAVWGVVAVVVEGLWWRRPRRSRWRRLNGARETRVAGLRKAAEADERTVRIEPGLFGGTVEVVDGKAVVQKRKIEERAREARIAASSSGSGFSGGGGSSGGGGASGGW